MDHFGHLFDFFATINAAFIVSKDFSVKLLERLGTPVTDLVTQGKTLQERWLGVHANIKTLRDTSPQPLHDDIDPLISESLSIGSKIDSRNIDGEALVVWALSNHRFNNFCLFGTVYSVLVLILIGLGVTFEDESFSETFLLFTVSCIVLTRLLAPKRPILILLAILIPACASIIYYFIHKEFDLPESTRGLDVLTELLAIATPSYYFISIGIRLTFSLSDRVKKHSSDLKQLENSINKLEDKTGLVLKKKDGWLTFIHVKAPHLPGEKCEVSGSYECLNEHPSEIIQLKKDDDYPPCSHCTAAAKWQYVDVQAG